MITSKQEVLTLLRQYNPWWRSEKIADLPTWRRAAFGEILQWVKSPPVPRALLLSGMRQIGKTTLFMQVIEDLLADGTPPGQILYATLDHPLLRLTSLDDLLTMWRESEPAREGPEYVFLDEIQYAANWQTWVKHQVDFHKKRRLAVTGSAIPLVTEGQESGVGRWHTHRLATFSFYEHMQVKQTSMPSIPLLSSLQNLLSWSESVFQRVAADAQPLVGHFNDYLLRGGFPQCAFVQSEVTAQKLIREDIVDKVLLRDMTALYGVRNSAELERVFLYLCQHDGGLLNITDLSKNLEVSKQTANTYIQHLEAAHLIYRLPPLGYGKEVLRGRFKVYLADPSIAPSAMLKGKSLLNDPEAMGVAVESAFFKHLFTRYYQQSIGFSYWREQNKHEVDFIAELEGRLVPFEVKYRGRNHTGWDDLQGLVEFCSQKSVELGYVITQEMEDFGLMEKEIKPGCHLQVLKIPAPLACYWLGASEALAAR